jgi:hypothetical protein
MELKATLDNENSKRFQAIKENLGVKSNQSVLESMIGHEYRRIQRSKVHRVFLPEKTYAELEEAAKARGQTVDEYAEETILQRTGGGLKDGKA